MPSRAAVTAATLTDNDITWVLPYILESDVYGLVPGQFPNLEADLRAKVVAADYASKFIAACITGLEVLTDSEVALEGGREAVKFDLGMNREMQIRLILSTLYDLSLTQIVAYSQGTAVAQQIPLRNCCPNCYPDPCCCGCGDGSQFV